MIGLTCSEPGKLKYISVNKPILKKGQAIIRVRRIGICGTDLHAFEGTQPYFSYPRILGHELAGELFKCDDDVDVKSGEAVTIIPYFSCGNCLTCRTGKPNCCLHVRVCGVHIDGGMVEYLSVPSSSLVHDKMLTLDELALIEPLAIGAHSIRRATIVPGDFVLVMGAGPIGLGIMALARIAGGKVIALDINERRLRFCRDNMKIEHIVNASAGNTREQLETITNGDMPTVVFDATGNLKAINTAFQYTAHGGRYVLVGLQNGNISFNHPDFHRKEGTLLSSRNATRQDFDSVINCIKRGELEPCAFVTHRVLFGDVAKEFEGWLNPDNDVIKVMVEFP